MTLINPAFQIESVDQSDLPDFYEVQINEGPLLYVHKNGEYMLSGTLFHLSKNELIQMLRIKRGRIFDIAKNYKIYEYDSQIF